MTAKARKKLAELIAARLFVTSGHRRAVRLELKDKQERGMGGWCEQAVADQIEEVLVALAGAKVTKRQRG